MYTKCISEPGGETRYLFFPVANFSRTLILIWFGDSALAIWVSVNWPEQEFLWIENDHFWVYLVV